MSHTPPPGETPTAPHVLVVDDEPAIGALIGAAAQRLGFRWTSATDHAAFRAALGPDVTLVVLDLRMPDVDGIELLREMAAEGCRARVVMLSGVDGKVLRTAVELAGSLGLDTAGSLQKPFRIADVQALLLEAHATRRPRPGVRAVAAPLSADELGEALAHERLVLHYQPQVHLGTGRVAGLEALVRLTGPDGALVFPDRFILVAEETQLMDRLTTAVINRALGEFGGLPARPRLTLSINISARSLTDLAFPERVVPLAESCRVEPSRLILEITESGLINDPGKALDILARLRMRGVGLSIDDFGTGYSSMAQLRRVPATELKVDRSFVNDMLRDDGARSLVDRTIELGHDLDMAIVAEGVETREQAAVLRTRGCDVAQGYLYSKPVAMGELKAWLREAEEATTGGGRAVRGF